LSEVIILQEAGVKVHQSASPPSFGLKAGAFADVGTLILTNRRLVYIMKGGGATSAAWMLGGALAASAIEKTVSQAEVDDLARYPGSYSIPLENITAFKVDRKMGGAYLSVSNNTPGLKPAYSFVFGSGFSRNDQWVTALNNAKSGQYTPTNQYSATPVSAQPQIQPQPQPQYQSQPQYQQPSYQQQPTPPPPPPAYVPPNCPYCGGQLNWIAQYQRWYCYRDQRYV
jgi:hypothetical protein